MLGLILTGVVVKSSCKEMPVFLAVAGAMVCIPVLVVLVGTFFRLTSTATLGLAAAVTTWPMSSRRESDGNPSIVRDEVAT